MDDDDFVDVESVDASNPAPLLELKRQKSTHAPPPPSSRLVVTAPPTSLKACNDDPTIDEKSRKLIQQMIEEENLFLDMPGRTLSQPEAPKARGKVRTGGSKRPRDEESAKDSNRRKRNPWTAAEERRFEEAIGHFGRDYRRVEAYVGTREIWQIRSHAQKYFMKNRQDKKTPSKQASTHTASKSDLSDESDIDIDIIGDDPFPSVPAPAPGGSHAGSTHNQADNSQPPPLPIKGWEQEGRPFDAAASVAPAHTLGHMRMAHPPEDLSPPGSPAQLSDFLPWPGVDPVAPTHPDIHQPKGEGHTDKGSPPYAAHDCTERFHSCGTDYCAGAAAAGGGVREGPPQWQGAGSSQGEDATLGVYNGTKSEDSGGQPIKEEAVAELVEETGGDTHDQGSCLSGTVEIENSGDVDTTKSSTDENMHISSSTPSEHECSFVGSKPEPSPTCHADSSGEVPQKPMKVSTDSDDTAAFTETLKSDAASGCSHSHAREAVPPTEPPKHAGGACAEEWSDEDVHMPELQPQDFPRDDILPEEANFHSVFLGTGDPEGKRAKYLQVRNTILDRWAAMQPNYLSKSAVRGTLKIDVNAIGRIHEFLELVGAINQGHEISHKRRAERRRSRRAGSPGGQGEDSTDLASGLYPGRRRKTRGANGQWVDSFAPAGAGAPSDYVASSASSRREQRRLALLNKKYFASSDGTESEEFEQQQGYNPFALIATHHPPATDTVAAFTLYVHSEAMLMMDVHAHISKTEVIGLLGGTYSCDTRELTVVVAIPCNSLSTNIQCELDPLSEMKAREMLTAMHLLPVGWYHSHPTFAPNPSLRDIENQFNYQEFFAVGSASSPFIGAIVSPYDPSHPADESVFNFICISNHWNSTRTYRIPYRLSRTVVPDACLSETLFSSIQHLFEKYMKYRHCMDLSTNFRGKSRLEKLLCSAASHMFVPEDDVASFLSRLRVMITEQQRLWRTETANHRDTVHWEE